MVIDVHPAALKMDEKQHVIGYQPAKGQHLRREEVGPRQQRQVGPNEGRPGGRVPALRSGRHSDASGTLARYERTVGGGPPGSSGPHPISLRSHHVHYMFTSRRCRIDFPNRAVMADQIVITEKPSQAKDVRAAVGSRYGEILPAEGHLFDLLEPEDVVPAWKRAQVHHLDRRSRRSDHVRRHEFGSDRVERDAFCCAHDERSSSVSGQRYGSNGSPRPCAFVRIVIARSRPKALRIAGAQAPAAALMWRPERRKPLVFTVIHNTGARAGLRDNSIRCERSHRLARRAEL